MTARGPGVIAARRPAQLYSSTRAADTRRRRVVSPQCTNRDCRRSTCERRCGRAPALDASSRDACAAVARSTQCEPAVANLQCATSGKTVRANKVARVFTIRRPPARIYYGCSRDTGRVHEIIYLESGSEYLEHPRLTGRYFAAEYWHIDFHESVVFVQNVRRGPDTSWGTSEEDEFVDDIEVTRRGGVAWLSWSGDVLKCDRNGQRLIGGTAGKLRRIGRTVYWRSEGKKHSYLLRGRASYRAC
jgi:hypothetical protein